MAQYKDMVDDSKHLINRLKVFWFEFYEGQDEKAIFFPQGFFIQDVIVNFKLLSHWQDISEFRDFGVNVMVSHYII